jgi:hypothetical protein
LIGVSADITAIEVAEDFGFSTAAVQTTTVF